MYLFVFNWKSTPSILFYKNKVRNPITAKRLTDKLKAWISIQTKKTLVNEKSQCEYRMYLRRRKPFT